MANGYRNALVQQIKDAGQELINRAESMVHPENDLITDFSIVIHFEQHEVPTIDYTTSVVNKVACDRVIYQKGESNVSNGRRVILIGDMSLQLRGRIIFWLLTLMIVNFGLVRMMQI